MEWVLTGKVPNVHYVVVPSGSELLTIGAPAQTTHLLGMCPQGVDCVVGNTYVVVNDGVIAAAAGKDEYK